MLIVTFFPSSASPLGTCGQAYWLSWVYFLMFTVRIWTKSNCLHYLVLGKKVWKKENQGRCHKLYRQWFMPCLEFDLLFYWNSLQLIYFPKGMLLKPKELKAYCLLADCCKCTLLWALSSEHLNHHKWCYRPLSDGFIGYEGQQLLANCWEAAPKWDTVED